MMLNLNADQSQAVERGEAVRLPSDMGEIVVVRAKAYERSLAERENAGRGKSATKDAQHWGRDNPAS